MNFSYSLGRHKMATHLNAIIGHFKTNYIDGPAAVTGTKTPS